MILRDVTRTQPALGFFTTREKELNEHGRALVNVLLVYAKTNPIRYVQGMNEVLAPLYYVLATTGEPEDRASAEADAFCCFVQLMSEINSTFNKKLDNAMLDCFNIVGRYQALLARLDRQLYLDITAKGLDPRFYALRWLSLLFSQEFELPQVLRLWDSLFADENRFNFLLFFACSLVLEHRQELLKNDFSRDLFLLQNLQVPSMPEAIARAERLMRFTKPVYLEPAVMARFMQQLTKGNATARQLLEKEDEALKKEIQRQRDKAAKKSTATPRPAEQQHQQQHQERRAGIPGALPDEYCTMPWHKTDKSA